MTRLSRWVLLGLMTGAIAAQGCSGCSKPPPVPLDVPEKSVALVFPASEDGWTARDPMKGTASRNEVRIYEPKLDTDGKFEISGQKVEIVFDDELFAAKDLKSAPVITITPAVPGRTVWTSARAVEFRADKHFAEDTDYTATLPEMTGVRGKKLAGGFKGTFRAKPEVAIAGKIVHYIPKAGEPRVVYVRPIDDREIGPGHEMIVLYDQNIELALAQKLVTMTDAKGNKIPLTLTHPPQADTFEGEKVDTRGIVLAKMAAPPAPGTKIELTVKGTKDGVDPTVRKLEIPQLPKLESAGCNDTELCKTEGTVIKGPSSTSVSLHFSNRVKHEGLARFFRVTPQPPKFRVDGWSNDIDVHGVWEPNTTYQIRGTGLVDRYGFHIPDVAVTFQTLARPAAAVLREGVLVMDETSAHEFSVTTRNVKKAELLVWTIPPGADALATALKASNENTPPTTFGGPAVIAFDAAPDPHVYARTPLDLWGKLEPGKSYLAQLRVKEGSHGAVPSSAQPSRAYEPTKPSIPLIMMAGKDSVGAHVHTVARKAVVSVFRLGSGEPVGGASVAMGTAHETTDDKGVALLEIPAVRKDADKITIKVGAQETILPLEKVTTTSNDLYPDLQPTENERERELVGVLITDRGIYRPGSKVFVKGHVRRPEEKRIAPAAQKKVRVRVTDATGTDIVDEAMTTTTLGTVIRDVYLPKTGRTGKYRIRLELDDAGHTVIAEESVRVAEFETPRFKVDIETAGDMPEGRWRSRVVGKYFFGAPMNDGRVEWTLKKKPRKVEAKKLEDAGFSFVKERNEFDSSTPKTEERPRTGEAKLRPDGSIDVDVEFGALGDGPSEVTFEADVSDASYRHVAAKKSVVRYPFARYAGLRLGRRFGEKGPLKVDLVAVDKQGKPLAGVPVEARLERLDWKKSSERAESGAIVESWSTVPVLEGTCTVTTEAAPNGCEVTMKKGGEYRISARVDGRDDATATFYAWGYGNDESGPVPSSGKRIPISADKKAYAPGDTAKVLAQSPFPEAMAVLTVESGGLLKHEVKRIKGPSAVFDVPLALSHAPHAHAVITLLPIGGPEMAYRIGALRLPVSLDSSRLTVRVVSAKKTYDTTDTAEMTVEVKRGAELVKNADVTLSVVDEGILRLTDFHAKDPTAALHPPRGLDFSAADSRSLLYRRREKPHVAGGGDAEGADNVDTRRNFVDTLVWLPSLVTDSAGRATAHVKLQDNLTEFRMMATVIGDDGSAGASEDSFVVTRPFLLEPILPSFALKGDKLEIAAMAHNNTDAAANVKVKVMGEAKELRIAPHSHERVSIPFVAEKTKRMTFEMEVDGKVRDKVEKNLRVGLPGNEEHPQLSGVFRERQEITIAIPEDAIFDDDAKLTLRTGAALYPELGQRLLYLSEYPHGCVEQTTSGTLPLLAARNLLPWTGAVGLDNAELEKRIAFGIKRLGTMQTHEGGLAFWPGGNETHVYGTVYAARALIHAKAVGIEEPGLLADVLKFLDRRLSRETDPVMKVAIAEVLSQAGELKPEAADSIFDVRAKLDAYGIASLALALSTLPKETERTKTVMDALEAELDATGTPKTEHGARDYHYWGSTDRDRAQALIAFAKLRPQSKLTGALAQRLLRSLDRYTTQSTAWSLLALSVFVGNDRPNGSVDVKIKVEGVVFDTTRKLGGDNKEVTFAMKDLRGKKLNLVLEGDPKAPSAFALEAKYVRPDATSTHHAKRMPLGPSVYRVFTDPKGGPIDLAKIKAGEVVRVALRIDLPRLDNWRATYLAVTDRLAAGFQPVQPDLATVASVPDIEKGHPFYEGLTGWGGSASFVDIRDDRVNVYFDHVYGGRTAYATYLMRATTPGEFILPSARGELMYEPGSEGYSEGGRVTIR